MKSTDRRNLFIRVFALLVVRLGFGMVIPVCLCLIDKLGASGSTLGIGNSGLIFAERSHSLPASNPSAPRTKSCDGRRYETLARLSC